jgi:hypothetical protein
MQNQPKFPTCLTNFTATEKCALDKMLDERVERFAEECVQAAKKVAQREGRQLSEKVEAEIRKSWKNWRETKRGDVMVGTLRPRGDKGQK